MHSFSFFPPFSFSLTIIYDPYHNSASLHAPLPMFLQGLCVSSGFLLPAWLHEASCVVPLCLSCAVTGVQCQPDPGGMSPFAALSTASIQRVGQGGEVFSKQMRKPNCLSVCLCWQELLTVP